MMRDQIVRIVNQVKMISNENKILLECSRVGFFEIKVCGVQSLSDSIKKFISFETTIVL